jgi:hypothetical protein
MTDDHAPTLQDIAADQDWWLRDGATHYRELARDRRKMPPPNRAAGAT